MTKNRPDDIMKEIKSLKHEVNNNLMVIFGYSELLIKDPENQEYRYSVENNITQAIKNLKLIQLNLENYR